MKKIKDKKGHYAFILPLPVTSPHIKLNSVPDLCEPSSGPQNFQLSPWTPIIKILIKTIVFVNKQCQIITQLKHDWVKIVPQPCCK